MSTLRAAYAKAILKKNIEKYEPPKAFLLHQAPNKAKLSLPPPPNKDAPIGIVGAGAAGLAVAICLHIAGYHNIEILEADPKRVGGRCFTFSFSTGPDCPHNYYDVGAMRIPQIDTMKSTFTWIDFLNDRLLELQKPQIVLSDYIYSAHCEPSMYFYSDKTVDPGTFEKFMMDPGTGILTKNGFIQADGTAGDFDVAFQNYINSADMPDHYSTRGFLMNKAVPSWEYQDTQTAEMYNTSTGLFDQAFMETICDFYDFQFASKAPWYRVEGGMSKVTDAMHEIASNLGTKVTMGAAVSAMSTDEAGLTVTVDYPGRSATYDALFTTTTLGALQRMDLSGLNLSNEKLTAIRALSYDRATKIAIKFSNAWWLPIMPTPPSPYPPYTYGGVSSSDLSISNVVYPSWDDGHNNPHTIIVSYSWAQDATRVASLISSNDTESTDVNDPLITMIFQQLQKLWSNVEAAKNVVTPAALTKSYIAHHAFSWSHDANATGGFALFGPGQFQYLYTNLTAPLLNNRFMVCGEAVSVHHAWISGALDSAYNAVYNWLEGNGDKAGQDALKSSQVGLGPWQHTAELSEYLTTWQVDLEQKREQGLI